MHDINKLIKHIEGSVELNFHDNEMEVLGQLSSFIVWAGRYPFPLNYQFTIPPAFNKNAAYPTKRPTYKGIIDKIYNKLWNILTNHIMAQS
jgi:hypothetical protein